jgi:hypothetical protein
LLAELGFTSYRFSIEWARVEPEDGHVFAGGDWTLPRHVRRLP